MTDFFIDADRSTTSPNDHCVDLLAARDRVVVNQNIHVTAAGAGANGIHSDLAANAVTVSSGAAVSSTLASGIFLNGTGANGYGAHFITVDAAANVSGGQYGVYAAGSLNTLKNSGAIRGATGAQIGTGTGIANEIYQSGSLIGSDGDGLRISGDGIVNNTGLIQGSIAGVLVFGNLYAVINNYGTIIGGVAGSVIVSSGTSESTVNNFGRIEGRIALNSADDVYEGRLGSVTGLVFLGSGNDRAYGGVGAERFQGSGGNDTIDGGGGQDIAVFSGAKADYHITLNGGTGVTIVDTRNNNDDTDQLNNVRFAQFSDGTVTLYNTAPTAVALSKTAIAENALVNTVVANLSATDADGDALTYSLLADGGGTFRLDGASLVLLKPLDYETQVPQSISVKARDAYGGEAVQTFRVDVANVIETTGLTLIGTPGDDVRVGEAGNDLIFGLGGNDILKGEGGNDMLYGGLGKDTLSGGSGDDVFVFDSRPRKATNLDTVTDYAVANDIIHLAKSAFTKIAKKGVLSSAAFHIGDKAGDPSDRVIYNKNNGALLYDNDGTGTHAAIQFGTLARNLKTMSHKEFYVI